MGINPSGLYDFAGKCAESSDEVSIRCAISRGYYAALHKAKSVLDEECEQERKNADVTGSHNVVISAYQRFGQQLVPGRTEAKQVARILKRIKDRRVDADYHLDLSIGKDQWDDMKLDVDSILEMLSILDGKVNSEQ